MSLIVVDQIADGSIVVAAETQATRAGSDGLVGICHKIAESKDGKAILGIVGEGRDVDIVMPWFREYAAPAVQHIGTFVQSMESRLIDVGRVQQDHDDGDIFKWRSWAVLVVGGKVLSIGRCFDLIEHELPYAIGCGEAYAMGWLDLIHHGGYWSAHDADMMHHLGNLFDSVSRRYAYVGREFDTLWLPAADRSIVGANEPAGFAERPASAQKDDAP